VTNASVTALVRSSISRELITSTSGSTGDRVEKCALTTRPGRSVARPSLAIGMDEVLEARMASGSSTTWSRNLKLSSLVASSSGTASSTSCRSVRSPSSVTKETLSSTATQSPVIFPLRTPFSNDRSSRRLLRAIPWSPEATMRISLPARAQASASPVARDAAGDHTHPSGYDARPRQRTPPTKPPACPPRSSRLSLGATW
jgi:hypothetical protein